MKFSALLVAASFAVLAGASVNAAETKDDLAPFPKAEEGQIQHVIRMPALDDEDLAKVQIIVGKTMTVDCNRQVFGGTLEERVAEGWGYNYYVLEELGQGASTLMACTPGSEREAFVGAADAPLLRYNSRLPLVVYTPADVELRYRVWLAQDEQKAE